MLAFIYKDMTSLPPNIGRNQVTLFLKRHNYDYSSQRTLKKEQQLNKDIAAINNQYHKLREVIMEEDIYNNDIQNIDKTRFYISISRDQFIIIKNRKL